MVKQKFYAVRTGRIPGIYQTWDQAEKQVKNFSGAEYKSFSTEEAALTYLAGADKKDEIADKDKLYNEATLINQKIEQEIKNLQNGEVIAFVDGSYSQDIKGKERYSFGAILITNESEDSLFKAFINEGYMKSHNVAGEIEGAKQAILWAINHNKHRIKIYYDYEGIEKWAIKSWKATAPISQEYSAFIDEKSKLINIEFEHVKAHIGIEYNEKADALANRALLSRGYKTYNDGSIYFIGFQKQDWINMVKFLNYDLQAENVQGEVQVNESQPKDNLDKLLLLFNGQQVTINCYKGNKSYVQGKQTFLFQKIISLAIEKLPSDNAVIEVLNTYHALTVEPFEVENAFSVKMPNFPIDDMDSKLRNTLLSAVYHTLIIGYMPDYTCLVTPLFRAMEFYLHRILGDKLKLSTTTKNGTNKFSYFSRNKLTSAYEYNASKGNLNDKQINYLNELYNRYNKIRHPYAHWAQDSIDTHVITDIKEAHNLISDGLNFLNEYYIIF